MQVELDPYEFQSLLTVIAQEELSRSGIKQQTGRLFNSCNVVVGGTEAEPEYILEFEDYGLFLDAGVQGTLSGRTGAGYEGKSFRYSGQFKMIGGNLPYAVRTSIYKFGIKPRPWVQNAVDAIISASAAGFEQQLTPQIEEVIVRTIEQVNK